MKILLPDTLPQNEEEENKIEKKKKKKLREEDLKKLKDKNMLLAIFGKQYLDYLNKKK